MLCKFCGKPLPKEEEEKCPHCFATWTPEAAKGGKKQTKTEPDTVNGHD